MIRISWAQTPLLQFVYLHENYEKNSKVNRYVNILNAAFVAKNANSISLWYQHLVLLVSTHHLWCKAWPSGEKCFQKSENAPLPILDYKTSHSQNWIWPLQNNLPFPPPPPPPLRELQLLMEDLEASYMTTTEIPPSRIRLPMEDILWWTGFLTWIIKKIAKY